MQLEQIIAEIRYHHRKRVFGMEQRKRADLALGAFLRTQLGWSPNGNADTNDAARKAAADLIALGKKVARELARPVDRREPVPGSDGPVFAEWESVILAAILSRAPFRKIEDDSLKAMEKLARRLPVHPWASGIRGFGEAGLAQIVAEAGDLSAYSTPATLWKRFGLAVLDGIRQGGLRKGASVEEWTAHGYAPRRRSMMWNIGKSLFKSNNGEYRALYLRRKAVEHAKALSEDLIPASTTAKTVSDWAALGLPPLTKVSKFDPKLHRSAAHMSARAQRYMEKRLLRDLWRAWREANEIVRPLEHLPPAEPIAAE